MDQEQGRGASAPDVEAAGKIARGLEELNTPKIDIFLLADRAEAIGGKLYLMGGAWDRIFVQSIAAPVPVSFAAGVLVPWVATNVQHELVVTIEDLDRKGPIGFEVRASFVTGRPPWATEPEVQRALLAIPTIGVQFPSFGSYQAVARVNGDQSEQRMHFKVLPLPQGMAGPPARG